MANERPELDIDWNEEKRKQDIKAVV